MVQSGIDTYNVSIKRTVICNNLRLCTIVEDVGNEIEEISRNFFMNNYEYVKDSAIPESLKYLLKNGMI